MTRDPREETVPQPPRRFVSREVRVGGLLLGGNQPIRIQSMVNTAPEDLVGTVAQVIRLAEEGCELVRLTVPAMKDVELLAEVTSRVKAAGIHVPLVADVHFNAQIAAACAGIVEKVRINPGNYRKPGAPQRKSWKGDGYNSELSEIEDTLADFISVCKKHHTAVRIGSNHGSLSPRITDRYGDTPLGMVEAALEFVRIFHRLSFHDLVLSMKSSNVRVMVQAYRLLVAKMQDEGFDYPIHLGVTEAGFGNEGRIKSAAGIGLLLDEGIGDTIRVSLTEDPVAEIPAARKLLERYHSRFNPEIPISPLPLPYDPYSFSRRLSRPVSGIGGGAPPVVIGPRVNTENFAPDWYVSPAHSGTDNPSPGWLEKGNNRLEIMLPGRMEQDFPKQETSVAVLLPETPDMQVMPILEKLQNGILVLQAGLSAHPGLLKGWMSLFHHHQILLPVILKINCRDAAPEDLIYNATITASGMLTDGLTDGLWLDGDSVNEPLTHLAFQILQATRARISAPEYISCPSCGRTRFHIQEVAGKIKERTSHLIGLKIGIMGCIVNGPGEMADADYGYVGSGNGMITLYQGKTVVQRGIPEQEAIDALIELIKAGGDWIDP